MFFLEDIPNFLANYPDSKIAQLIVTFMDPSNLWVTLAVLGVLFGMFMIAVSVFLVFGLGEMFLYGTQTNTRFWIDLFFDSKLYTFIQGFGTW